MDSEHKDVLQAVRKSGPFAQGRGGEESLAEETAPDSRAGSSSPAQCCCSTSLNPVPAPRKGSACQQRVGSCAGLQLRKHQAVALDSSWPPRPVALQKEGLRLPAQ